jgi:putative methyltransferase (TIGR04325 family)
MKIPSFIEITARKILASKYGWSGDYSSWKDANLYCSGYDQINIMERVKAAAIKVKKGEAVYERDSVLFNKIEYSWPLLSALMWVSNINKGRLNVIDFGGSLGSSYFQNKSFLDAVDTVKWNIVEQKSFVDYGREFIQDNQIHFFHSIKEAIDVNGSPDILVISCTLPYLEDPHSFLNDLMEYKIPYLIVDNTPFNYENRDRLTVQKVHPSIYEASYPCWLLSYDKVLQQLADRYMIISEFENDSRIYVDGRRINYRGLLAKIKSTIA